MVWINIKNIILRERSQHRRIYIVQFHLYKIPENLNYDGRNEINGRLRQRFGGIGHEEA